MNTSTYINRVHAAKLKLDKAIEDLEESLKDKIDFDFFIQHQPSDGYCLATNEDTNGLMRLATMHYLIEKNGKITLKDFKQNSL